MHVSRRNLFKYAAAGSAAAGLAALSGTTSVANAGSLGTLLDYAAGVPSAQAIKAAGYAGAIRYVSDRRPGADWMVGKPVLARETDALTAAGLQVVSCYQFGKGGTADWRGAREAGKRHASRGLELHAAAGGPSGRPIYASIDDNPTSTEITTLIAPYLEGWASVVGNGALGIYGNTRVIDAMISAGVGTWFWQHNWGSPAGYVHPRANLHQFEIDKRKVDGVGVDLNSILTRDYGQWSLAGAVGPVQPVGSSLPTGSIAP
ncbi:MULTISPECIES: DUF1906 domain-containing protein [Rhodococcus]|uniref:Rv2525c-like glycoside hydrolase-like domain-containing protein n=2 Tax=Rhodococcus erythropolis TaxID=1833 RepID=C1A2S4_RHOE4|nr:MULTISPECIES: DUF1906 domain-containing protein [Rhodococcus]NRH33936.1 DUF1906 domain-containing protein [Rhodococcus sp. MS13]AGT93757.1 hypothetical protein O5Y_19645 [Rhodococcus erythropolis CCM2595]MBH5145319.1 DUF1906 domain-containing protein [Rhodococcus erythropolis]MBO8149472.1 DUF1906 domain-containing protein [Rhodococcus erythropolis]MBT1252875.1 DUF1906 domain-containing protein [Rhodococcus erythropolis]